MILTIAILALLGMIISILTYLGDDKVNANAFLTAIAIIAWWKICLTVSIILLCLAGIIGVVGMFVNEK
jgi:hypothetical protein